MEFNKIAGAIIGTLLLIMVVGQIGNALVPPFYPHKDKPGAEGPGTTTPEVKEPEKPVAELLATADTAAGEKRAANACVSCHTLTKGGNNGVGPNLWDVVGRKRGGHPGYAYSDGLKNAGGEWTYDLIFKYLANPAAMIPGSKMAFRLTNAEQRAQVLAFLRTRSDAPKPLPAVEKKTEAPPKTEAPKTEAPKTEAPKTEAPKTEPPKAEPGKADEKPPAPATPPATPPAATPPAATPPAATPPAATPPAEEKKN